MTITKMWGSTAAGEGSGVGSGAPAIGVGVCFAVAWAVELGAHAASRQAEMTRATNRILYEPTIRGLEIAQRSLGAEGPAGARRADHLAAVGRRGAARARDRYRRSAACAAGGGDERE